MVPLGVLAIGPNPSWLVLHPALPVLYACHEIADGSVSAWTVRFNETAAAAVPPVSLSPLGRWATGGDAPMFASIFDGTLMVANYGSGTTAGYAIDGADGALAARPSFEAIDGAGGGNAHAIVADGATRAVFVPDLGLDRVYQFHLGPPDAASGAAPLVPNADAPELALAAGSGPRQLVLEPAAGAAYLTLESAAALAVLGYDAATGALALRDVVPTVDAGANTIDLYPAEVSVVKSAEKAAAPRTRGGGGSIVAIACETLPLTRRRHRPFDIRRPCAISRARRRCS
jgi:6-phosphogluconolactonase (cycloisomerase 2 family)